MSSANWPPNILAVARAEALFASSLPACSRPAGTEVAAAICAALRTYGGTRGCAGEVAAAYGEYPECAAPRMRWARQVVQDAFPRYSDRARKPPGPGAAGATSPGASASPAAATAPGLGKPGRSALKAFRRVLPMNQEGSAISTSVVVQHAASGRTSSKAWRASSDARHVAGQPGQPRAGAPAGVRRGGDDRERDARRPGLPKPAYLTSLEYDPGSLTAACVAGDQQAWRAIVERLSPLVWTIARSYRLSLADCQDVYQLTWMRAVQHLHQLRSPDRLAPWIATIARRECKQIDRSRSHDLVGDTALFNMPEPHADLPDDVVVRKERNDEVLAAFRKLPARDQALLGVLMADPPPSYDEAGRLLGLPIGSIGPRRQRALTRLRGMLQM